MAEMSEYYFWIAAKRTSKTAKSIQTNLPASRLKMEQIQLSQIQSFVMAKLAAFISIQKATASSGNLS